MGTEEAARTKLNPAPVLEIAVHDLLVVKVSYGGEHLGQQLGSVVLRVGAAVQDPVKELAPGQAVVPHPNSRLNGALLQVCRITDGPPRTIP
jgi:hypothetical protein